MYFIRVSWKYIAKVEMEAEGGREKGERGERVGQECAGHLTCSTPSHTFGITSCLHNRRVGKLGGRFLCATLSFWS